MKIAFLLGCLFFIIMSATHQNIEDKKQIASMKSEIAALKKSQSTLAAGLLDLHEKDVYVQEVMNEASQ